MLSLEQIEKDLTAAMKEKNQLAVETLRGLKTRVQNEKISKMADLSETDMLGLVRSEVKRRKEAAQTYQSGGRGELAQKELDEAAVLEKYLPQAMPEEQLQELVDKVITENNFTAKDFGQAMAKLKGKLGAAADGAILARMLKEKLKS